MRPFHVGDDFLGHPNETVTTPFILPNLVTNHLVIALFLDHIGGAFALVPSVGLGVDERTLDCEFLFVLLIRKLLPWLRALVGLVAFFVALRASHDGPLLKLLHHVLTVILRRLDIALHAFALQSIQVLHEPSHFLLELIIFLGNEIIT